MSFSFLFHKRMPKCQRFVAVCVYSVCALGTAHCTDCKRQRITVSSYKGTWNGTVIKPRNSCKKRYLFSSSFESFLLIVFSTTRHTNGWALIGVGSRSVWNERSRLTMHGEECCVSGVHRLLSSNRIFNKSKTYLWDADWPLHTCKSIVIELDTNCGSKGTQNTSKCECDTELHVRDFRFRRRKCRARKSSLYSLITIARHINISARARVHSVTRRSETNATLCRGYWARDCRNKQVCTTTSAGESIYRSTCI